MQRCSVGKRVFYCNKQNTSDGDKHTAVFSTVLNGSKV